MIDPKPPGRGPGRPRAFDERVVLDAAMRLFWRDGYAATSVPEISSVTGLSTSSLYNAYGSKLDLLVAALDHYHRTVLVGRMLGPLVDGGAGLADIDAFLDRLAANIDVDPPRSCLAVNTIAEFRDPPSAVAARTSAYRDLLRRGLHAGLTRAVPTGDVPPEAVAPRADALVAMVIAFNLLVAARAPAAEARDLLRAARTVAHGGTG